ncbi:MAG TPA: hypothetical protein VJ951_16360, partial [Bacteroidales bacterium]|nr:hypothetical protein [Bacteroidales bacterium]
TEFVEETENERFNFSDIEVINKNNSLYFSITTGPYKDASYQYIVGLGYHQNRIDQVSRIVKLYGTQTTDQSKITRLIKNFFCNDIIHLTKQLEQLDFLIELNDTYHNY